MADDLLDMVFAPMNLSDSNSAQAPRSVTPGASPWTYRATSRQALHVVGGTISTATYARGAITMGLGIIAGGDVFELNAGDTLTIAYLIAPTVTMIPR